MTHPIDLYQLLPALYRREDAGLGLPLEALLDIISTEVGHVQRNITDLWDDFFIETAAEWAIPYIGDLIGSSPLHNVAGSRRADVANTIFLRRRKGTLVMLEEMAAGVTGWGARAVPYFELLQWSQNLDHIRLRAASDPRVGPAPDFGRADRVSTANILNIDAMDRVDGPFDEVAHSVDVRPFGPGVGRHNIRNIGFFLWRLQSQPLFAVTPRAVPGQPHGFHFSPLGAATPLFTNDEPPPGGERAEEPNVPGPIRPLALHLDLLDADGDATRFYGPASYHSLAVAVGDPAAPFGSPGLPVIPASAVTVCDLSGWRRPGGGKAVAVDPRRGRLTLSAAAEPGAGQAVRVSYGYGFSGGAGGDMGGGVYDRRDTLSEPEAGDFRAAVAAGDPGELPAGVPWHTSIDDAVAQWLALADPPERAVVEIHDNGTYVETASYTLPRDRTLEIRALNRRRPVIEVAEFRIRGSDGGARLVLNGVVVIGGPLRIDDGVDAVTLVHSTLVPGRGFDPAGEPASPLAGSLLVTADAATCAVTFDRSITGSLRLPDEGFSLTALDSIVDAVGRSIAIAGRTGGFGPVCDLRRTTILGGVRVRAIGYASDVLFDGDVEVERTQRGCVRLSYVDDRAATPRRYRCQPDLALEGVAPAERGGVRSRLRPRFTSRRYGAPGYAQLAHEAAPELRTGAENEAEMGAFNRLMEAQRIANLRIRLDEYLPAGLEAGIIFET
jgi:hypothetical protein